MLLQLFHVMYLRVIRHTYLSYVFLVLYNVRVSNMVTVLDILSYLEVVINRRYTSYGVYDSYVHDCIL